jgi:hypothetical protein
MKKGILIALFVTAAITLTSCDKLKQYCAECTESYSGYSPSDFCGIESQVDEYISELKSQGNAAGQSWTCTKYKE